MKTHSSHSIMMLLFAFSALYYLPLAQFLATGPRGSFEPLFVGQYIYCLAFLIAFLSIPYFVGCLIRGTNQRNTLCLTGIAFVTVGSVLIGLRHSRSIRMDRMQTFVVRSRTVVNAIERFQKDHQRPPNTLDELVPDYLSDYPTTGMSAYRNFRYHTGSKASDYGDNEWALSVFTPDSLLNFDRLVYYPNQAYPKFDFGGRFERIDDWAYVHD